jgi:hypothetical protein
MPEREIADRMATIRHVFEDARLKANEQPDNDLLIPYLENFDSLFRSVAYEGASMSRALNNLAQGKELNHWFAYLEKVPQHSTQAYIGLGWAIAQRQVPVSDVLFIFDPIFRSRIIDGYGYYEGMFRQRYSVRDKIIPDDIKGDDLRAYDQGLGRSLWYTAKGSMMQLAELINDFPGIRKSDLWRGAAIAVAYIGAFDKNMLDSITRCASDYQIQLAIGAALLARSRWQAGTLNTDTGMICRHCCHLSAQEAAQMVYQVECDMAAGKRYIDLITILERTLLKTNAG